MSERMQAYRERMKEKGLVQVRVWVDKQDEYVVKFIARFCRKEGRKKKPKERFGRPVSDYQIRLAQAIAEANSVPEPRHLYGGIISAWAHGCGVMEGRDFPEPMRIKTKNIGLNYRNGTKATRTPFKPLRRANFLNNFCLFYVSAQGFLRQI